MSAGRVSLCHAVRLQKELFIFHLTQLQVTHCSRMFLLQQQQIVNNHHIKPYIQNMMTYSTNPYEYSLFSFPLVIGLLFKYILDMFVDFFFCKGIAKGED